MITNKKTNFYPSKDKYDRVFNRNFTKNLSNIYEFYLCGEIENSGHYIEWFDIIRNASENDVVKIYINSEGGDAFTAIQFIEVLRKTSATIIVSVEGICASSATMIMLCADIFEISPHSILMFHNYSGVTIGKGGEMLDQLKHEHTWSANLLKDIYDGFLSDEEITSMLNNKDIWMGGEEAMERLKVKIDKENEKTAIND